MPDLLSLGTSVLAYSAVPSGDNSQAGTFIGIFILAVTVIGGLVLAVCLIGALTGSPPKSDLPDDPALRELRELQADALRELQAEHPEAAAKQQRLNRGR